MVCETYIGRVKDKAFDYDLAPKKDMTEYTPTVICYCETYARTLYWDIVGAVMNKQPNTKRTDWGCFVWKMDKAKMIELLSQEKYNFIKSDTLSIVKELPDTEDYLLVAKEIY